MVTIYVQYKDEEICAAFQELAPCQMIKQVRISIRAQEVLCDITGWGAQGMPSPVYAQKITDSGDAQAVLIYGGECGIILKPSTITEPWNPDSPLQDHRAYMVVSCDTELIYVPHQD